jgi:putative transposase
VVAVSQRKQAVRDLKSHYDVSARRACRLTGLATSVYCHQPGRDSQQSLRARPRELTQARVRKGYKRIHILLKREGERVGKKRVHWLCCL